MKNFWILRLPQKYKNNCFHKILNPCKVSRLTITLSHFKVEYLCEKLSKSFDSQCVRIVMQSAFKRTSNYIATTNTKNFISIFR